jgi:serine/threonine protein kinase/Tfp pilus assembly protein PilF
VIIKCPKCETDNPSDSKYCKECATPLLSQKVSVTRTLETPTGDLVRGTIFADRYEIIEELGKGGMGSVYRVADTKLNQEVALKLIKPEIAQDKKSIERFRNELKLARNIRHKNVCGMFDLGETEGAHFITMEYVRGEDLKSFIHRSGQLAVGTAVRVARQVCEGLAEAHKLGVVHRDLKSSNIMIDRDGNARIMDFGIARSLESEGITGAGVMIGTPEYMSPEQVEGKEADQRSDIYSLGIILFEMVAGRLPFEADTPLALAVKHRSEIPPDPRSINPQVPSDFSRLVLRCLEKVREKRFQSVEDILSELGEIEKSIPTTDRAIMKKKPLSSREITVQFSLTLRKLFVPASVLIAVAVIAITIWKLLPKKEAAPPAMIENSIAVTSFENQTGDEAFDNLQKVIPNLLITNLENSGYFYVVTWERMRDLLKQMGKGDAEFIDQDMGFEICRREGVKAIVLGTYAKAGEIFVTDVKVLDVASKKSLKSATAKGQGVESVLQTQIDELSQEIAAGVGLSADKIGSTQWNIAELTTSSAEAYNAFIQGMESYYKFDTDNSQQHFERAVKLDPSFAMAYLYLSYCYGFSKGGNAQREALENAKKHAHRASEKERLYIEARYAGSIERNPQKRFILLQELVTKYPQEKNALEFLASYYQGRDQFPEALQAINRVFDLDPDRGTALNLAASIYTDMGNFGKAEEYFKKYISVSPGEPNPYDSLGVLYFRMGKLDDAVDSFKQALAIMPEFGCGMNIAFIFAMKGDYVEAMKWIDQHIQTTSFQSLKSQGLILRSIFRHLLGRYEQSLTDINLGKESTKSRGSLDMYALFNSVNTWFLYERGEIKLGRENGRASFDSIKEVQPHLISLHTLVYNLTEGFFDVEEGKIESAKTRLDTAESLFPSASRQAPFWAPQVKRTLSLLHAEILLAQDLSEEAVKVMEKAEPMETPSLYSADIILHNLPFIQDVLARAYAKKGDVDEAIAEYERLVTFDPEGKWRRLIHPKYFYRVAILYEQKGNRTKAIQKYEKFLDLWKDADPGLPEAEDAKKRLAGLKSR